MRIALTITELDPGGAETCLVHLACFLARRDHEVRVFALGPAPVPGREQLTQRLDAHGIPWKCGARTRPWQCISASLWLRKELREFSPEVVQSMLFHANVMTSLALPASTQAFLGGARVRQPERLRWRLQRWSTRGMAKLICVSQDVAEHCASREKIPTRKLVVIPNGIQPPCEDITTACWTDLGLPQAARVILSVGRLAEQKGYAQWIESADAILSEFPDHHLVIMGDGPLRSELEELRQRQVCRSRIHLVGWQENAICWMRLSELFVLPTRYEGMPNVLLEAMSVSRAVVAFGVEGVAEVLGQGSGAAQQIAAPNDMLAFVSQTKTLLRDAQLRLECGQDNQQRVRQEFDLQTQLARYEALYLGQIADGKKKC